MSDAAGIRGFHAHVYFDDATRPTALRVRDELARRFAVDLGRIHDRPVGPHAKPMFQVAFTPEQFAALVPWLMVNRSGLSVFVHPRTGDAVADHDTLPLWMGPPLPLDIEFVRRHAD